MRYPIIEGTSVYWPMRAMFGFDDDPVTEWLEELTNSKPLEITWQLSDNLQNIIFTYEEDAILFKLKFGY
jgi:hypothetical protein